MTIAVSAADEAQGLASHAKAIAAQHAPDLFHVQRPLWQALAWPLATRLEWPAAVVERAAKRTAAWHTRWREHQAGRRAVGRPPNFERHIVLPRT